MREAGVLYGQRALRIVQLLDPPPPPAGWVQVQPHYAALCGSDLGLFCHPGEEPLLRRHPKSRHLGPFIIGHEFSGVVVAVGAGVVDLDVDQRIVTGAGWWCGACPACLEGAIHLCQDYYVFGLHADGGMVKGLVNLPAKMCVPIPDELSMQAAAFAQPCAIAMHCVEKSAVHPGCQLVIFGIGGIGMPILSMASARGIKDILAVDVNEEHLLAAKCLGATVTVSGASREGVEQAINHFTGGRGAELILECTGAPDMPAMALKMTRRGGRIHLVGIQKEPIELDLGSLVRNEIQLSTSNGHHCLRDLPAALSHLVSHPELVEVMRGPEVTLATLVDDGLLPMVERRTKGKVLVRLI